MGDMNLWYKMKAEFKSLDYSDRLKYWFEHNFHLIGDHFDFLQSYEYLNDPDADWDQLSILPYKEGHKFELNNFILNNLFKYYKHETYKDLVKKFKQRYNSSGFKDLVIKKELDAIEENLAMGRESEQYFTNQENILTRIKEDIESKAYQKKISMYETHKGFLFGYQLEQHGQTPEFFSKNMFFEPEEESLGIMQGIHYCKYHLFLNKKLKELEMKNSEETIGGQSLNMNKIKWNDDKSVLLDLMRQLKTLPGKKSTPLISNSYEDLAIFLKSNFECFTNTEISTILGQLKKQLPMKKGRIKLTRE